MSDPPPFADFDTLTAELSAIRAELAELRSSIAILLTRNSLASSPTYSWAATYIPATPAAMPE